MGGGRVREGSVTLERDTRKKDREEELHQPQPTWAEGKEEEIFLQSQLTSIALQFFPPFYSRAICLGPQNDHNISAGSSQLC